MPPKHTSLLLIVAHPERRTMLQASLESAGYYVITTAWGTEGIEMLKNMTRPSAIVIETDPNHLDETLSRLKTHREFAQIPVVQVSAEELERRESVCCFVPVRSSADSVVEAIKNCATIKPGEFL